MSSNTTNYNLVKPDANEFYDIAVINDNMDILDSELNSLNTAMETKAAISDLTATQSQNDTYRMNVKRKLRMGVRI